MQPVHQPYKPAWRVASYGRQRRQAPVGNPLDRFAAQFTIDGRSSAGHGKQHAAKTEQVATLIYRLAPRLFGRHIVRGPGQHSGPRQRCVVGGSGQAKVRDDGSLGSLRKQHVGWLDVAMDKSL